MLVCNEETKELYLATDKGRCTRLLGNPYLFHFAYPIADIIEHVKRETSIIGANRTNAEGASLIDNYSYSDDEFDLDKSITRDAMAQVWGSLQEYARGVGDSFLYDSDQYKIHKVKYNRGYKFFTEHTVSELDKSITVNVISNKVIANTDYLQLTVKVKYDKRNIYGELEPKEAVLEHKFISSDTYTTVTRTASATASTANSCAVSYPQINHYCLHHRGLPCKNVAMINTDYCHQSCRCYAPGESVTPDYSTSASSSTEPTTETWYKYTIRLTPAYETDEVDNGLGREYTENISVPNIEVRPFDVTPTMITKGDWLELEMPDGSVEIYLCHATCTTNNKFACPTYYRYMMHDLRHTIHFVLYFSDVRIHGNLQAADQMIHDAIVDYCIYRWYNMVAPTEGERYYTSFQNRMDIIKSYLQSSVGRILERTPRLF